jgi:hypothetical protein
VPSKQKEPGCRNNLPHTSFTRREAHRNSSQLSSEPQTTTSSSPDVQNPPRKPHPTRKPLAGTAARGERRGRQSGVEQGPLPAREALFAAQAYARASELAVEDVTLKKKVTLAYVAETVDCKCQRESNVSSWRRKELWSRMYV